LQKLIYLGRAVAFAREKGEVKKDLRGISQAELLAETMVEFLKNKRLPVFPEPRYHVEWKLE
jgi:hypothetical protein